MRLYAVSATVVAGLADCTLTDGEVAKVRGKIVKRLREELGARLRG